MYWDRIMNPRRNALAQALHTLPGDPEEVWTPEWKACVAAVQTVLEVQFNRPTVTTTHIHHTPATRTHHPHTHGGYTQTKWVRVTLQ